MTPARTTMPLPPPDPASPPDARDAAALARAWIEEAGDPATSDGALARIAGLLAAHPDALRWFVVASRDALHDLTAEWAHDRWVDAALFRSGIQAAEDRGMTSLVTALGPADWDASLSWNLHRAGPHAARDVPAGVPAHHRWWFVDVPVADPDEGQPPVDLRGPLPSPLGEADLEDVVRAVATRLLRPVPPPVVRVDGGVVVDDLAPLVRLEIGPGGWRVRGGWGSPGPVELVRRALLDVLREAAP